MAERCEKVAGTAVLPLIYRFARQQESAGTAASPLHSPGALQAADADRTWGWVQMEVEEVAVKYGLNRAALQGLQESAGRFAGMAAAFCQRLGWHDLELLIAKFQVGAGGVPRSCLQASWHHHPSRLAHVPPATHQQPACPGARLAPACHWP